MSKRGKIYSVACNDFVTYDEVIFFPGENLNIIIGPNGTGKSTLVAAIVLGMGGKPELLSRSSALTDWIKHGCDEALIELNIFEDDNKTIVFQRSFNQAGLDEYKVNDKKISRKQFLLRVKEFNIQVDNLCQFLPQDRVQDFAKMNPQEMLANTQVSVCSEEIQTQFQSLLELRKQQLNVGKDAEIRQKEVEDLQAKNEALRPQIENIRARGDLMKDLEIGKKKIAWLNYDKWTAKVVEFTNDLNQATGKLIDAEKKLAPIKNKADSIINEKKQMETKISSDVEVMQKLKSDLNKQHEQLARLTREIQNANGELQDAIVRSRDRKQEIRQVSTILVALKQDLTNLTQQQRSATEIKAQIDSLQQKFHEFSQQKNHLMIKRGQIQDEGRNIRNNIESVKHKLTNMENEGKRKLASLRRFDEHAYNATMWLQENRNMFKGHIYNPILLELQLKDQVNAKYLENTIQLRDFSSFGCEDADDVEVFLHEMRVKLKLKVNAYHTDPSDHVQFRSTYPVDRMQRLGFKMYLIDTINGPAPILNYLCKIYRLHDVPICEESTGMKINSLPREIRLLFTPSKRFTVTFSRYTGNASSASSDIHPRNFIDAGVDPTIHAEQQRRLNELVRQSDQKRNEVIRLDDQIKQFEEKIVEVNNQKRSVEDSTNAVRVAADKVKRQQQKLEHLQNNEIDVPAEREKYKKRITQTVANMFRVHEGINANLKNFLPSHISWETQRKKLEIFRNVNHEINTKIHALEEEVSKARRLVDTIQAHANSARQEQKTIERDARKLTDNKSPNDKNFPYKTQFAALPNNLDDVTKILTDLQARIDCMGALNQNIIDEFEQRAAQIERMNREIHNTKNRSADLQMQIGEIHEKWYSEVNGVVQTINANFSRFMSLMNLAGEVELTRQGEYDYTDYGITIRVKYRASDKMAVLDRTYQSGGERAVAIAVYTLSLQHLSHVPFRCVDEINQGMDPKNERKIFEMLVDETCKPGHSQYFFVTPKLLPNLHYNQKMEVFIVHNGKCIDDPYVFVKDQLQ